MSDFEIHDDEPWNRVVNVICALPKSAVRQLKMLALEAGVPAPIYGGWLLVSKMREVLGEPVPTLEEFAAKLRPSGGYVYLMRADNGLYKIGKATHPKTRLAALRCASPVSIALEYAIRVEQMTEAERAAHAMFADKRSHGEWFALTPADVRRLKRLTADALCGQGVAK